MTFYLTKDEIFNQRQFFFQYHIKSFHMFKFRVIALEGTIVTASSYFSLLENFISMESSLWAMLLILKVIHMYLL